MREGKLDIAGANRVHAMPALADDARHRCKRHLLGKFSTSASNSRVKPDSWPTQSGSTSATLPSGDRTRGTRTSR